VQNFWELLLRAWAQRCGIHPELSSDLSTLVAHAGTPPRVSAIRDWETVALPGLSSDQRQLWDFVRGFYPGGGAAAWAGSPITPEADAKRFHEARGRLAWFRNTESMGVPD
jgi:hypothetical protein